MLGHCRALAAAAQCFHVASRAAGITNPFIARGARLAAKTPSRHLTGGPRHALRLPGLLSCQPSLPCTYLCFPGRAGLAPLDNLLHHLLTPAFLLPQALNLVGSVLFAASLGSGDISVAAPVANGGCSKLGPACRPACPLSFRSHTRGVPSPTQLLPAAVAAGL